MTATTYFTSANQVTRHSPLGIVEVRRVLRGTAVAFTPHRYNHDEDARELTGFAEPGFMRFAQTAGPKRRELSRDVPKMADDYLRGEADSFLAAHGLFIADVSRWVCHPGGPKVLDSIRNALGLPDEALAHPKLHAGQRQHLLRVGA
jgi:hypothetical protein